MAGERHGMCELAVRVSSSCKIQFYELGVINMNNGVSVIAAEDGLELLLDR
jgi:hypothetical protein